MQICSVCSEQTPKYKCPVCKIRYCSVSCYQRHKATDTCLPVQELVRIAVDKTILPAEPWTVKDILDENESTDKVPNQMLQLLGESETLRDLLRNPHLRQLMRSIDAADRKDEAMKAAMQEPLFVELADECLKTVQKQEEMPSYESD